MAQRYSTKIVSSFYLSLCPDKNSFIKKALSHHTTHIYTENLTSKNLHRDTEVLGVFVDSKLSAQVLDTMPNLKLIVTLSVGFDHIDLDYAKKKGIAVCNIPNYGENTVAEHALALLLAFSRRLFDSVHRVQKGRYDSDGLRGLDIQSKTIGVLGTGRIGLHFIKLLQGFGANVIAFDAFPRKEMQKEFHFKYVSLEKVLKDSDIISVHIPLLPSTKHLINKKSIAKMKKGVILINTARGAIVESEALLSALEKGKVRGVGLDVFEGEEYVKHPEDLRGTKQRSEAAALTKINKKLIDHPHVLVTPHNAFNSEESIERMVTMGVETIENFFAKKKLPNRLV